jgi:hypothetical protein
LLKNSKCSKLLQIERERRPHRYEPNATCLDSNGRRERDISRSVQIYKQAKKRVADCTVHTDTDVAGRTTRGKTYDIGSGIQIVAGDLACLAANGAMTCGPVQWPPRVIHYLVKTYVVGQSQPRDLRAGAKTWQRATNRRATTCYLLYIWHEIYISLNVRVVWAATGPGLSPNPWSRTI